MKAFDHFPGNAWLLTFLWLQVSVYALEQASAGAQGLPMALAAPAGSAPALGSAQHAAWRGE